MSESTSDQFIRVMGRLQAIEESTTNEDPMRHAVRNARRAAIIAIHGGLATADHVCDGIQAIRDAQKEMLK